MKRKRDHIALNINAMKKQNYLVNLGNKNPTLRKKFKEQCNLLLLPHMWALCIRLSCL